MNRALSQDGSTERPRPRMGVASVVPAPSRVPAEGGDALTLVRAVRPPSAMDRPAPPVASVANSAAFHELRGQSDAMREVYRKIARLARTDVTVLVNGESGTGKTLAAHAVHAESPRRLQPFVVVNCAALRAESPGDVAFFDGAHGGTLLLDEIGDLNPAAQTMLLRALERHDAARRPSTRGARIEARGDVREDVRIVATSNRPLERMVRDGRFRHDLLYRLRVATVTMPPLRERTADIPALVEHALTVAALRHRLTLRGVDDAVWCLLRRYDWPGNVRELHNVIETALVLSDGPVILARDLPSALTEEAMQSMGVSSLVATAEELPFVEARERALREFDRAYLSAALQRNDGNVARTARALGLHRQSLQKLLVRRELRPAGDHAQEPAQ
ncbi:MAG: sigma 54-interacting transcriptional regulator [Gemmatimonadaceae bacterium]|nr:sigma 54-interacting transcriptional regulator [Gemmatimonadaceae bacterium]